MTYEAGASSIEIGRRDRIRSGEQEVIPMGVADRYYMQQDAQLVAEAMAAERVAFIRKTYLHLFGAVLAFVGLTALLFRTEIPERLLAWVSTGHGWLLFLGGFMLVSWIAERWARGSVSLGMQYLGLGVYVAAEAVIFLPILYIATNPDFAPPNVLPIAATLTLSIFGALTIIVLFTRKDFSFLQPALYLAGIGALLFIVASIIFGFAVGNVFVFFMIIFACGYILYHTSNVLHQYHTNQHVAASLALFASVALLFWYVLRLVMALKGDE
ncbi:MAG TPA: Bax inhibitor-1 family protein [Planctomycetota bacterium]|nr:Bax inhibitor-1 family protein [Planctomycetota bacterium]